VLGGRDAQGKDKGKHETTWGELVSETEPTTRELRRPAGRGLRWARLPRPVRALVVVVLALVALAAVPFGWTRVEAADHLYDEADVAAGTAPAADVVIVLGAQVAPGASGPMPFLRGRLDTAAQLVRGGQAKVILVSGDAGGGSGDETAVMATYLMGAQGIGPERVVVDPHGLDTYDSCRRAKDVYGVDRAHVVTQPYHLARAVALCRQVGIDADGVGARCDGCTSLNLVRNSVRDYFACSKAVLDALRDRPAAVSSPPSAAVAEALARV
jgi:vancomycin permeability regulator SanA